MTIKLHNWSVIGSAVDTYKAPELQTKKLRGNVFGHPEFADGDSVKTSTIVKVDGRKIHTRSGSCYTLGRIDQKYRNWMKQNNIIYDAKNPIKVVDYGEKSRV
jgi:hypothetical protein